MTRGVWRTSPATLLCAASLAASSCGTPLLKLPTGTGTPATDGAAAVAQATSACRAINTITLEMSVHGTVGGRRLRGRLSAGLARPASARLEAVAPFGQPIFVFVAMDDDASLLLPRDRRVLEHGKPADVLEAVSGVPLDAAALRFLVTGCAEAPDAERATAFGDDWRAVRDGPATVYLRRSGADAPWRLVARIRQGAWRADYSKFDNDLPHAVHLVSRPAGRFDLQLDLSQIELNVALGPEAFKRPQAGTATPIGLEELRQSGPLGEK
ncbi:MAG TPA: hypothetical protein VLV86_22725 [Vicinamibacterales bacterium]|nr:hypothetical protein [Vicinamibacterales bacterium]